MKARRGDDPRETEAAKIARFVKLYARKARKGLDPNDRGYDREVERQIKAMKPEELDRLLRDGED